MDEILTKLKEQVDKIDGLKDQTRWGPEFQLWKSATEKLVRELFGEEGYKLFKQQGSVSFSYLDESYDIRQYLKELDNRKKIIEGLLSNVEEHRTQSSESMKTPNDVLKEIWRKEQALKENLLPTKDVQNLHNALLSHLDNILPVDSLPGLRFKKMKAEKRITWWSSEAGYPIDNPWQKFEPFLELLAQHEAEKTIKRRLETEGLFAESRSQGEDQHLLIGKKDGTGDKTHLVIDGKSGEIRIEDNRKEPTELLSKIETILTLPNGKKIRTTREAIEETT